MQNTYYLNVSVANSLAMLKKNLENRFPSQKITPFILQAWGPLTNGKDPSVEMTRQFNSLRDTTGAQDVISCIDDNDAVAIAAWRFLSCKVTSSDFASAVFYDYAKTDVYNAAPSGEKTELQNMRGMHNFGKLSLDVSGDTIINEIPTLWFERTPPAVNTAGSNDATPDNGNWEHYKTIYEPLLFAGNVRNTWNIKLGGDNNTIAGDSTATEQNYVVMAGIGFKIQDGEPEAKAMIKAQGHCIKL
ncbi:MAG: hypothetical protein AAFZ15_17305 [Bacteroidota bacterium]